MESFISSMDCYHRVIFVLFLLSYALASPYQEPDVIEVLTDDLDLNVIQVY